MSELEDVRRIYLEKKKTSCKIKRMKNTEERLRHIEVTYKSCNKLTGVPRGKKINGPEAIFKELVTKTFPKLMKDINL